MRDPVRIAFALFNPVILMFAIGYGISFDVEHLRWAVFNQDQSLEVPAVPGQLPEPEILQPKT